MKDISSIILVSSIVAALFLLGFLIYVNTNNERNRITEGLVINKEYSPAWTSTSYIIVNNVPIPQYYYYPESYHIEIQGEKDGEIVEYRFEVTAEEYAEYKIGDYYMKYEVIH